MQHDWLTALKAISDDQLPVALGLEKARERHKWRCPRCGKPNLHINNRRHPGGKCYTQGCEPEGPAISWSNIDLVMAAESLDFKGACAWLSAFSGIEIPENRRPNIDTIDQLIKQARRRTKEAPRVAQHDPDGIEEADVEVWETLKSIFGTLTLGNEGRAFLSARGIDPDRAEADGFTSIEAVSNFHDKIDAAGYDIDVLCYLGIKKLNTVTGEVHRGMPWWHSLVIPLSDSDQVLDSVRFRTLSDQSAKWRYLSLKNTRVSAPFGVWSLEYIEKKSATVFVTEGELDAYSIIQSGHPAIGGVGSGSWRDSWTRSLEKFNRVVIVADADVAGRAFAQRIVSSARRLWTDAEKKIDHRIKVVFPGGKDANDALRSGALAKLCDYWQD